MLATSSGKRTIDRNLRFPRTRAGRLWLDAPLRLKLALVGLTLALVWTAPIVLALVVDADLNAAREEVADTSATLDELNELQEAMLGAGGAVQNYLVLGLSDLSLAERYEDTIEPVPDTLRRLQEDVPADLSAEAEAMGAAVEGLLAASEGVLDFGAAGTQQANVSSDPGTFELSPVLVGNMLTYLASIEDTFDRIEGLENQLGERLADSREEIEDHQQVLVWGTIATMATAIVVMTAGTYWATSGVVRRIVNLTQNAQRFLKGEPLAPTMASADEVGLLGEKMLVAGELLNARGEEALAATRAKDEFLARVGHELKTPLRTMVGFAGLLEERPDLPPESREDAGHIVHAGDQLQDLIEEMLDIEAIEAGELALSIAPVSVEEVADETITLVQQRADDRSITIDTDCEPGTVAAADRRRLREILLNLLSNAIKYNREGGRIDVVVGRRGDMVRLSVTDTGPGISPQDQKLLFRPFERLGAGRTDVEGSGIGLSLTRKVVDAMHGTIGVESAVGQGSTFWVDLPAADAAAGEAGTAAAEPPAAAPAGADAAEGPAPGDAAVEPAPDVPQLLTLPRVGARTRLGQRWLDASLGRKLLLVVLLIALTSLPPITMAVVVDIQLVAARDEARATAEKVDQLNTVQRSIQGAAFAIDNYMALGLTDAEFVAAYRQRAASIPDEMAALQRDLPADLTAPADAMAEAVATMLEANEEVIDLGAGRRQAEVEDNRVVFPTGSDEATTLLAAITVSLETTSATFVTIEVVENRLDARLEETSRDVERIEGVLVLMTVISSAVEILLVLGMTVVVANGVVRRIQHFSNNADRYLRNEELLPTAAAKDEIGRLEDAMLYAGELLNQRREEAVAATRAKDEFLSRVSHELKTPLTAMIGFAQLLEEEPALPPDARDDAANIVRAGHRLHSLIQEMLDIKAIEAGRLSMTMEAVAVRETAEDTISLVQPSAVDRSISIDAHCPEDAVAVADRRRLREVLLNLLSNAVKYNREGGRVDLAAARHDGMVHIEVTDTGPGISPEDQQLLFKPFERLSSSARDLEGTGIGLSLTQHVVEAMNGRIGVESVVGEGSTFWVDLPAAGAGTDTGTGRDGADLAAAGGRSDERVADNR